MCRRVAAADPVRAHVTVDRVGAGPAGQRVVVRAAGDEVVAVAAVEFVRALGPEHRVVAVAVRCRPPRLPVKVSAPGPPGYRARALRRAHRRLATEKPRVAAC
jgi:hypothetical protein